MATLVADIDCPEFSDVVPQAGPDTRDLVAPLAAQHWIARGPVGYMLTRHEDCIAVLKDRRWHQATRLLAQMNPVDNERYQQRRHRQSILTMEGDEHQRLRRLVSGAFTPKAAGRLRPFMREVMNELIDPFAETGRCEFVTDVCEPYPIPIICELLGAPREDWEQFSRWATSIFKIFSVDVADFADEIVDAGEEIDAYVLDLIATRRGDPRDDLLSDLIAAEEAGEKLSPSELVMMVEAVILAGTDTTRNQLACALAAFADHPEQWAALGQDPSLAARATEESFRWLGAIRGTGRFASEDIEYRDVVFPAGTVVFPSFVAANHDADSFACPHAFDISEDRTGSGHLTLGFGTHYCLGANLARAEMQEALTVLSQRMPNMRIDGEITWKPDGVGIWGPAKMPLAFDPVGSAVTSV